MYAGVDYLNYIVSLNTPVGFDAGSVSVTATQTAFSIQ